MSRDEASVDGIRRLVERVGHHVTGDRHDLDRGTRSAHGKGDDATSGQTDRDDGDQQQAGKSGESSHGRVLSPERTVSDPRGLQLNRIGELAQLALPRYLLIAAPGGLRGLRSFRCPLLTRR
jgi:hypothetical protein